MAFTWNDAYDSSLTIGQDTVVNGSIVVGDDSQRHTNRLKVDVKEGNITVSSLSDGVSEEVSVSEITFVQPVDDTLWAESTPS